MSEWLKSLGRDLAAELSALIIFAVVVFVRGLRRRLQAGEPVLQNLEVQTITKEMEMEQKIIDGVETDLSLKVEDKKLKVLFSNDGKIGGAKAELYMKLEAVVDALEEAIPGDQKSIAAGLKAALGLL